MCGGEASYFAASSLDKARRRFQSTDAKKGRRRSAEHVRERIFPNSWRRRDAAACHRAGGAQPRSHLLRRRNCHRLSVDRSGGRARARDVRVAGRPRRGDRRPGDGDAAAGLERRDRAARARAERVVHRLRRPRRVMGRAVPALRGHGRVRAPASLSPGGAGRRGRRHALPLRRHASYRTRDAGRSHRLGRLPEWRGTSRFFPACFSSGAPSTALSRSPSSPSRWPRPRWRCRAAPSGPAPKWRRSSRPPRSWCWRWRPATWTWVHYVCARGLSDAFVPRPHAGHRARALQPDAVSVRDGARGVRAVGAARRRGSGVLRTLELVVRHG